MPVCGFNQKMIDGLDGFQTGLVEHGIIHRSKIKSQSFDKTIQNELSDMERFRKEMHNIKDLEIRELTLALTNYACAFYKLIDKNGIDNYKKTITFLNKYFFEMDRKYYSDLEGKKDDMRQLVEHLNKIN